MGIFERKEKKKDTHLQKLRIRSIETILQNAKKKSYLVKSQILYSVHLSGVKAFFKLHGVPGQNVCFLNLALTERNLQLKFDLKLSVCSLCLEIWPLLFKFHFGLIGWPLQPPTEKVQKLKT